MKYNDYKLCYIDDIDEYSVLKFYFTSNLESQWGDDWDDRPANCNAGSPYEDENHDIISMYIELPYYFDYIFGGKTYSVEDLNTGKATWLIETENRSGEPKVFSSGMTYKECIDIFKANDIKYYLSDKITKEM